MSSAPAPERSAMIQGPESLIGREFDGWKIDSLLGSGAKGAVFRVSRSDSQVAALKVLATNAHSDPNDRRRFVREALLAAMVRHPNVIRIMAAGEAHGLVYLVMELVDGYDLGWVLQRRGALPVPLMLHTAQDACRGLAAIHQGKVLHRDVKPENLLITERPQRLVKIADFGLARVDSSSHGQSRLTASGMVVGTPVYLSPESIRGSDASSASDVYAMGATLFHLAAGRPPFVHETTYDVLRAHLTLPPPLLQVLRPRLPVPFCQAIDRCLAKDPAQRPAADYVADVCSSLLDMKP